MLSESVLAGYQDLVNQQAQEAAAIMILGPGTMKNRDGSSSKHVILLVYNLLWRIVIGYIYGSKQVLGLFSIEC